MCGNNFSPFDHIVWKIITFEVKKKTFSHSSETMLARLWGFLGVKLLSTQKWGLWPFICIWC